MLLNELLTLLVNRGRSVEDMKTRVSYVYEAMRANFTGKIMELQNTLRKQPLKEWCVKPLPGDTGDEKLDYDILAIFANEKAETVDQLLTHWPSLIDVAIKKEMLQRKPDTLKVEL